MIHPDQVDWADLTANQFNGYLNRLPEDGPAVLAFLAPEGRIQSLWPQLRRRAGRQYGSVAEMDSERRCLCIEGGQQHLMIVSWGSLLDSMATRSGIKTNLGWNQRSGNCEVWPSLRTLVRSNPFARGEEFGEESELRKRQ